MGKEEGRKTTSSTSLHHIKQRFNGFIAQDGSVKNVSGFRELK